ncbi:hypothetical protein V8E53_004753, partial [Lactarius tabidus]
MSDAHLNALAHTCTQPILTLNSAPISSFSSLSYIQINQAIHRAQSVHPDILYRHTALISHATTRTSNTSLFLPSVHGRTLTAEVHSVAQSVLTALENFARAHLSLIARVPTKAADPQGLSRSNLVAVRKHWLEHSETVSDAEAMLEFEAFACDDDDDKDTDDKGEQGPEQHAKTILPVVHHASALLKDVNTALLSRMSRLAQSLPDTLLDSAPPFAAAEDNLAGRDIQRRDEFAHALATVATAVKAFWKEIEDPRPANEKGSRVYFIDSHNLMQPSSLFSGRPHPQTLNESLVSPYIVRVQLCTTKCQNSLIGFIV